MSTGDLTAGELRIFIAIEREGSFSAAAQKLGLTQSAVSHAVNTAERKVGAVLFQRGRGGAQPTTAGKSVLGHARRILRLMDTMKQEARTASAGETTGTVRVAAFRGAAFHLLPSVLGRFGRRYPRITVDVSVVRETEAGIPGQVRAGLADLGVATLFSFLPSKTWSARNCSSIPTCWPTLPGTRTRVASPRSTGTSAPRPIPKAGARDRLGSLPATSG